MINKIKKELENLNNLLELDLAEKTAEQVYAQCLKWAEEFIEDLKKYAREEKGLMNLQKIKLIELIEKLEAKE